MASIASSLNSDIITLKIGRRLNSLTHTSVTNSRPLVLVMSQTVMIKSIPLSVSSLD